jgi:hypothetical protein
MASNKAIESIRKIQEAARRKVQERLNRTAAPELVAAPVIEPVVVKPKVSAEALAKAKRQLHAKIATSVADSFDALKRSVVDNTRRKNNQVISDILPQNCRFYQMGAASGAFIIEYQPMRRTIFIGHEDYSNKNATKNVPFPYFYFYIAFRKEASNGKYTIVGRGVGARTSPLSSIEDELGRLPLCHTQGNTHVCLPMTKNYFDTPQEMAEEFIESFWRSRFVYHFETFNVGKQKIKSWDDWEKLDVMDMMKVSLHRASQVKTLLASASGYENAGNDTGKLQSMVGRSESAIQNAIKDAVNALDLEKILAE